MKNGHKAYAVPVDRSVERKRGGGSSAGGIGECRNGQNIKASERTGWQKGGAPLIGWWVESCKRWQQMLRITLQGTKRARTKFFKNWNK